MPRKGPRRPQVAIRLSEASIEWVDGQAAEQGVNRSEFLRRLFAYASQHMPKGWKPKP